MVRLPGSADSRRSWTLLRLAPLALLAGCASVWGFDDLTLGDAGVDALDATEAVGADAARDGATGGDARAQSDAGSGSDGEGDDSSDGAGSSRDDAGETGTLDSGVDAAAFLSCQKACPTGCCDMGGLCHPGNATAACGMTGGLCVDCPGSKCVGLTSVCCTSKGVCGCSTLLTSCN